MNILFLTLLDFSSLDEMGIYTDLLREFVKNGHNVYVISPIERRKKMKTTILDFTNCKILKLKIGNVQKTGIIEKGISTLLLEFQFMHAIKKYFSNVHFDLVLYSTPPVTFFKAVEYVKIRDNALTYLLLKDILPQGAVDLNVLQMKGIHKIIYKFFRSKEKSLYQVSDLIGCMSEANVKYILKHNPEINDVKVEVCPNSIDPQVITFSEEEKIVIRRKYNIPIDKTVFIYGGNLGKPQGIDFLINCIKQNENNKNSFFLIVGSGTEFNKLQNYFSEAMPKNAKLLGHLPKLDYERLANFCDVGLIFLDYRFTIPNFPSRVLSYMQVSMPVLAATDSASDLGEIIENGKFGLWCESNDCTKFNSLVEKLSDPELIRIYGENSRRYLDENFTANHSYEIIMKHFKKDEKGQ